MNREKDREIKKFFEREAEGLTAPDSLKCRIDRDLDLMDDRVGKADRNMYREDKKYSERKVVYMKFKKRKMVFIAAAIVVIGSITCFATGKVTGISVGSSNLTEVSEYSGLSKAEERAGIKTGMPESFSNGYQFKNVNTGDGQAVDADGNGIPGTEYTDIFLSYEKDGKEISVSVMPRMNEMDDSSEERAAAAKTRKIGAFTVNYYETTMKMVPPDYELTEQDKKDMENPNFSISYGSDQVKVNAVHSLEWRTEDKIYTLLDMTGSVDADTMFSMAQDVIEGK